MKMSTKRILALLSLCALCFAAGCQTSETPASDSHFAESSSSWTQSDSSQDSSDNADSSSSDTSVETPVDPEEKTVEIDKAQYVSAASYALENGEYTISVATDVDIDLSAYADQIEGEPVFVEDGIWGGVYPIQEGSDHRMVRLSYADFKGYVDHDFTITFEKTERGVVTKKTYVKVKVYACTYVIKTAADLDAFGAMAKHVGGGANTAIWDGHFVLGNNIEYNKEFTPFITRKSIVNVVGNSGFVDVINCGFKGTFDGQGYNINGLTMHCSAGWQADNGFGTIYTEPNASGFIGLLHNAGTIKNVSFTNGEITSATTQADGFLCYAANGKIENVYVHLKKVTNNGTGRFGTLVGLDARAALQIRHCYVHIDEIAGSNADNVYAIGSAHIGHLATGNLVQVYATGTLNGLKTLSTGTHTADVYRAWSSKANMKNANVGITAENGWDQTLWTLGYDGCPIMKNAM